ncbi:hypothetical protein VTK73DRAFT_5903 [Phialemonium thermophilum]|uniref:Transmembrane protein n=1 Tax=Phialemonium thermophilum TaxID=223376 RepID=A0ABR3V0C5_9PEZI
MSSLLGVASKHTGREGSGKGKEDEKVLGLAVHGDKTRCLDVDVPPLRQVVRRMGSYARRPTQTMPVVHSPFCLFVCSHVSFYVPKVAPTNPPSVEAQHPTASAEVYFAFAFAAFSCSIFRRFARSLRSSALFLLLVYIICSNSFRFFLLSMPLARSSSSASSRALRCSAFLASRFAWTWASPLAAAPIFLFFWDGAGRPASSASNSSWRCTASEASLSDSLACSTSSPPSSSSSFSSSSFSSPSSPSEKPSKEPLPSASSSSSSSSSSERATSIPWSRSAPPSSRSSSAPASPSPFWASDASRASASVSCSSSGTVGSYWPCTFLTKGLRCGGSWAPGAYRSGRLSSSSLTLSHTHCGCT